MVNGRVGAGVGCGEAVVHGRSQASAIVQNYRIITILCACDAGKAQSAEHKSGDLHVVTRRAMVETGVGDCGNESERTDGGFLYLVEVMTTFKDSSLATLSIWQARSSAVKVGHDVGTNGKSDTEVRY